MPNLVYTLNGEEFAVLRTVLEEQNFLLEEAPYMHFKASKEKNSLCAYLSGKLVIQGKGADEIREFILEPLVLKEKAFKEAEKEEVFTPHAGMDESGKGDFFGPLVVAAVYVPDRESAEKLKEYGVRDSKLIKSDKAILETASRIRTLLKDQMGMVTIGPEAYNRIYHSFGSLNRLLAWGLPDRAGRRLMARSAALLLTALLGHWFYAQSFGNCVSVTRLLGLFPRKPELVDAVLTEIPPGATVAADRRSATMVMFRNRIVPLDRAETADYVYYNRRAGDAGGALHRRLLNDPAYGPVFRRNDGGGAYWLFRRGAPRPAMPMGEILDDAAWQQQPGEPLDCGDPAFSIKVLPVEMNGRRYLRFAARKNAPAGDDGEFQVTLRSGGSTRYFSIFYGNGLRAAGDAQIGEVFVFGAEIPDAWASLDGPPEIIYRKI